MMVEYFDKEHDEWKDDVGGIHSFGTGWNPHGVWCGECCEISCAGCVNENLSLPKERKINNED